MDFDKDFFSKNLVLLRKNKGLTQSELASTVGLQTSTVGSYETGASLPSLASLVKIAEVLNVSINRLLTGKEFPYDISIHSDFVLAEGSPGYGLKAENQQLTEALQKCQEEMKGVVMISIERKEAARDKQIIIDSLQKRILDLENKKPE